MNVFTGRIDHAPESKLVSTFARKEQRECIHREVIKYRELLHVRFFSSYIRHKELRQNTFRVNDETISDFGDFLVNDRLHSFFSSHQSRMNSVSSCACVAACVSAEPDERATLGHLRECQEIGQQGAGLPSSSDLSAPTQRYPH